MTREPNARQYDRERLTVIYDTYHAPILRYIRWQVDDTETARDLSADVFRRLLDAVRRERGPERDVRAWLYRTARNIVIDFYRKQQFRTHSELFEHLTDNEPDPALLVDATLSAEKLRAAIQQLTPEQRDVIILKFVEGLSNAETARIVDKPIGAVKSLQHRALAALQRTLAPMELSA
jgi:RNA polymerase sigma-70 factor (ECF subfamily)